MSSRLTESITLLLRSTDVVSENYVKQCKQCLGNQRYVRVIARFSGSEFKENWRGKRGNLLLTNDKTEYMARDLAEKKCKGGQRFKSI